MVLFWLQAALVGSAMSGSASVADLVIVTSTSETFDTFDTSTFDTLDTGTFDTSTFAHATNILHSFAKSTLNDMVAYVVDGHSDAKRSLQIEQVQEHICTRNLRSERRNVETSQTPLNALHQSRAGFDRLLVPSNFEIIHKTHKVCAALVPHQ